MSTQTSTLKIEYINNIAISKKRGVIFLIFTQLEADDFLFPIYNYENNSKRSNVMKWLDKQKIDYQPCYVSEDSYLKNIYEGALYLDVIWNKNHNYKLLSEYFGDISSGNKVDGVLLTYLTLYGTQNKNRLEQKTIPNNFWDNEK